MLPLLALAVGARLASLLGARVDSPPRLHRSSSFSPRGACSLEGVDGWFPAVVSSLWLHGLFWWSARRAGPDLLCGPPWPIVEGPALSLILPDELGSLALVGSSVLLTVWYGVLHAKWWWLQLLLWLGFVLLWLGAGIVPVLGCV